MAIVGALPFYKDFRLLSEALPAAKSGSLASGSGLFPGLSAYLAYYAEAGEGRAVLIRSHGLKSTSPTDGLSRKTSAQPQSTGYRGSWAILRA